MTNQPQIERYYNSFGRIWIERTQFQRKHTSMSEKCSNVSVCFLFVWCVLRPINYIWLNLPGFGIWRCVWAPEVGGIEEWKARKTLPSGTVHLHRYWEHFPACLAPSSELSQNIKFCPSRGIWKTWNECYDTTNEFQWDFSSKEITHL